MTRPKSGAKARIPPSMRLRILEEAGFQCAYCGHRDGLNLTTHHIQPQASGGETSDNNLIALCHNCHNRVDNTNTISTTDIRRLKRHLVHQRLTQAGVNALKLAYRDSVGVFSPPYAVQHLVEEHLLEHIEYLMKAGPDDSVEVTALYRITDTGRALVKKWLKSRR